MKKVYVNSVHCTPIGNYSHMHVINLSKLNSIRELIVDLNVLWIKLACNVYIIYIYIQSVCIQTHKQSYVYIHVYLYLYMCVYI